MGIELNKKILSTPKQPHSLSGKGAKTHSLIQKPPKKYSHLDKMGKDHTIEPKVVKTKSDPHKFYGQKYFMKFYPDNSKQALGDIRFYINAETNTVTLEGMMVQKSHRGEGYATELLNVFYKFLKENNYSVIETIPITKILFAKILESSGFRPIEDTQARPWTLYLYKAPKTKKTKPNQLVVYVPVEHRQRCITDSVTKLWKKPDQDTPCLIRMGEKWIKKL